MLRQNTFTVVPNPLGMQGLVQRPAGQTPSRPPMTTKQAQKLYRQSTRQPKISKAEQRRREKEEQERIRKELDKQRQTSRARSARAEKKQREQRLIEEKKRKGLPTVKVSASQDTISRFVRGNNAGRKRDSTGKQLNLQPVAEESENAASETEEASEGEGRLAAMQAEKEVLDETIEQRDSPPRMSKRPRVDSHDEPKKAEGYVQETGEAADQEVAPIQGMNLSDQRSRQSSVNADDPIIEDMVNTQLMTEAAAAASSSPHRPRSSQRPLAAPPATSDHAPKQNQPVKPSSIMSAEPPSQEAPEKPTQEPAQVSSMHPPRKLIQDPPQQRRPLQETSANQSNVLRQGAKAKLVQRCPPPFIPTPKSLPDAKPRVMAAPTLMHRFKPQSLAQNGSVERPRFLPRHLPTPASRPSPGMASKLVELRPQYPSGSSMPPTSTQLFVLSHLDDLFPTPSQEAIELQLPGVSPITISKPVMPCLSVLPRQQQASKPEPRLPHVSCAVTAPAESGPQGASATLPFFSTQDFVLSSQDIRDVEQTTDTPSKVRRNIVGARKPHLACAVGHARPNVPRPSFSRACATVVAQIPKPLAQPNQASKRHGPTAADTDWHRGRGPPLSKRSGPQVSSGLQTPSCSSDQAPGQVSQTPRCNAGGIAGVNAQLQVGSENRPLAIGSGKPTSQRLPHPVPETGSTGTSRETRPPNPSASAPKRRFFTLSNNEGVYLAKERSIRTLREEARAREASCQGRVEPDRKLRVESGIKDANVLAQPLSDEAEECFEQARRDQALREEKKRKELEELEMLALQLHEEADEFDNVDPTDRGDRQHPQHQCDEDQIQCQAEDALGRLLEQAEVEKQVPSEIKPSQETDYGDPGWSESELDALDTLGDDTLDDCPEEEVNYNIIEDEEFIEAERTTSVEDFMSMCAEGYGCDEIY